jgi:hypothetical protein
VPEEDFEAALGGEDQATATWAAAGV